MAKIRYIEKEVKYILEKGLKRKGYSLKSFSLSKLKHNPFYWDKDSAIFLKICFEVMFKKQTYLSHRYYYPVIKRLLKVTDIVRIHRLCRLIASDVKVKIFEYTKIIIEMENKGKKEKQINKKFK